MIAPAIGQVWRYKNSDHASDREIVLVRPAHVRMRIVKSRHGSSSHARSQRVGRIVQVPLAALARYELVRDVAR